RKMLFGFSTRFGTPPGLQDLFLCDESVGVLDEVAQHVECLRPQRHPLVAAPQTVTDQIEPERVELLHRSLIRLLLRAAEFCGDPLPAVVYGTVHGCHHRAPAAVTEPDR